jgi:hypothetical protein
MFLEAFMDVREINLRGDKIVIFYGCLFLKHPITNRKFKIVEQCSLSIPVRFG